MKNPHRPLIECFKISDKVTASHVLWEQFYNGERKDIPKLIFYVRLHDNYGMPREKDEQGNLGYHLEFVPKS